MEHDEHYSESESAKEETHKLDQSTVVDKPKKELFADFILKQKDFTVGAFKREYTGGNYKWPLTLSVVCLNDIPYGIRMGFYDLADCTENGFYLSIYTSDWINDLGNFTRLYEFLNRVGFSLILKKILIDKDGKLYVGSGTPQPNRVNNDSLERLIEISIKRKRRRKPRYSQIMDQYPQSMMVDQTLQHQMMM